MNVPHGHHLQAGHYTPYPGPPVRQPGFSRGRALPVMVACGLAMGVFAGLVVVRGTGEAEGSAGDGKQAVAEAVTPPPARPPETVQPETGDVLPPPEVKPETA